MRPTTSGWTAFCLKFLKISKRQKSGYQAGSRLWICLSSQTDWSMTFDDFLSFLFTLLQLFHLFVQVFDPNPSVWKCEPAALFPFFFFVTEQQARISPWNFPGSKKSQIKSFPFLPEKDEHVFDFPYHGDSTFYNLYHFTPLFFLCFIWYDYLLCKACAGFCTLIHVDPGFQQLNDRHDPKPCSLLALRYCTCQ